MVEYLRVKKETNLNREIYIAGAKNAALPILMSSILATKEFSLNNVPILEDVKNVEKILKLLGFYIHIEDQSFLSGTKKIRILPPKKLKTHILGSISQTLRASIWALAPILAKFGKAELLLPGGCKLGDRKIDFHIEGLKKMGANIFIEDDKITANISNVFKPLHYIFPNKSVGATISLVIGSVRADGISILENCALEPEVQDLCNFLVHIGANISGIGTEKLVIKGVEKLGGEDYTIIPDRIEAGTYMCLSAISGSNFKIYNINLKDLTAPIKILSQMGVIVKNIPNGLEVISPGKLNGGVTINTEPFPGFPTDLQPLFSVLLCLAKGKSYIKENIFENRYLHLKELEKMGAKITYRSNQEFIIEGVKELKGIKLYASDLRAAASLVIAAMSSTIPSQIYNIHYLKRGYTALEHKLLIKK